MSFNVFEKYRNDKYQRETDAVAAVSGDVSQDVQGTRAIGRKSTAWKAAVLAAAVVLNTRVETAADSQPTQPETRTQEVSGVTSLRRAAQRFARTASLAQLSYYSGEDAVAAAPVVDTWIQAVSGQTALERQQAAFTQRAGQTGQFYWTSEDLSDGPLGVQPDTWTQPVPGTASLGQKSRVWLRTVVGMGRLWQTAQDLTFAVEPETWTQAVQGTSAGRQQTALQRVRGVRQAPLWQTMPEEDGPLGAQPETWPQPLQGTTSTARAARAFTARAGQTAVYWNPPQDPAPIAVLDQSTSPVSGTSSLQAAQQRYWRRALTLLPFLQQTPEDVDGPLATQPDTYVQSVQGTSSLLRAARRFWILASRPPSSADVTVQAQPEPDTWQPPTAGTGHLRRAAVAWLKNVFKQRNSESDGSSAALQTQVAPYVPPVVGTPALRLRWQEIRRRTQPILNDSIFDAAIVTYADTEVIATAVTDTPVTATSIAQTPSIDPVPDGAPVPATLGGLRVGDQVTVTRPTGAANWFVTFDPALLRFDGPGTITTPGPTGWHFTVIAIGTMIVGATPQSGPPIHFEASLTSIGLPLVLVTTTYEPTVSVIGTVE